MLTLTCCEQEPEAHINCHVCLTRAVPLHQVPRVFRQSLTRVVIITHYFIHTVNASRYSQRHNIVIDALKIRNFAMIND